MIYLIDEQTNRQNTYSWGQEKFSKYGSILKVFSAAESLSFDKIKAEANIVLLHESFPDE